jgi:hypothetical protein
MMYKSLNPLFVLSLLISLAATTAAQSPDSPDPEITWDDAPNPPAVRHLGEWMVQAGWYEPGEIFGPFDEGEFEVGDETEFVSPAGYDELRTRYVLRYKSDYAYFWFLPGNFVDEEQLASAAEYFDNTIYLLTQAIFGEVTLPGIDNDPRLHIIHEEYIGYGAVGIFRPHDQCPVFLCPDSNQRDAIFYSLDWGGVNTEEHLTTLTHEFQHVIRFAQDGNERRWMNEGLSQLAEHLGGFAPENVVGDNLVAFLDNPNSRLDGWSDFDTDPAVYYGSSFLFLVYLYEQFGLDFIQQLAASPYDGLAAVHQTLRTFGTTLDQVFVDWLVANYVDNPYVAEGQFYYSTLRDPIHVHTDQLSFTSAEQKTFSDNINQYGAVYFALEAGRYDLLFDGADQTTFTGNTPHSGQWMWWAADSINSAARLTRQVDLRGVDEATLQFSLWYDIERDYDWFDVMVSLDGGHIWKPLRNNHLMPASEEIPVPHFTGRTSDWIEEKFDLTPYVGQEILIRFEYVTDGNISYTGVMLDDITIPEIGLVDNAEKPDSGWLEEGFIRIPEMAQQGWTLAFITDGQSPTVEFLPLTPDNIGRATLEVLPEGGVLVIGAMAPLTAEKARYKMVIEALD